MLDAVAGLEVGDPCRVRRRVPALDAWLAQSADPLLAAFADRLAVGFDGAGARALVAVALDFWTWERLDREGLDDVAAADLMTVAVRAAG